MTLLVACCLAGCRARPEGGTDCGGASLLYASADPDTDAVCRVIISEDATCSGTLVGPDRVLTAKHCVQHVGEAEPMAASQLRVSFGADAARPDAEHAVARVHATPGSYTVDAAGEVHGALIGEDLAVLDLASAVRGVPALQVDVGGTGLLESGAYVALGFGRDESGGDGVRERKEVSISRVEPALVWIGPDACSGDSGGPLLSPSGRVVGVASATRGECGTSDVMYTRLDAHGAFLRALDVAAPSADAGAPCRP